MRQQISDSLRDVFKRALSPISRLFNKGESVIGIDVGSSSIKIVQLKKRGGKAILETYGELALGPYANFTIGQATRLSQKKISEALNDVIREANITSRDGGISIPLSSSLVLVMEIQTSTEKQLKEMIPIEARKYIPVPISEVTLDWSIMPEDFSGEDDRDIGTKKKSHSKTKVLIAAIHNNVIGEYKSLADSAKLDIKFLEIEVFSSIRSLLRRERTPVLIIDIGAGTTKISVVENGITVNTHIINKGSQNMSLALSKSQRISLIKAEEIKRELGLTADKEVGDTFRLVLSSIFRESNKVLLQYEKKNNKTVSKVILSGGGSLLKGIIDLAKESFNTEIVLGDPFVKIETPAFLDSVLKNVGPNFAVAIGIALRRLQEIK